MKQFSPALLTLALFMAFVPQPVAAAAGPAPSPDPTHPVVMQQAAGQVAQSSSTALAPFTPVAPQAAVGGAGGPLREVFGFALASSLADPTVGYPSWNFSLLSTVAFFGLHVQGNGTFASDQGANVWNSSQLSGLLTAARSHGTKVVLTIILQDFSAGTPAMCAGLANSATTVTNTVAEVKAKGVDGVNIDYEGLNGSCASTSDPNWARHAFVNFVASLRSALPQGSYLSVDTYASSASDPAGFFDIPGLNASVDSFFVMAYDLEYSNYKRAPLNCSSFCLGPTAPLTGYYYNDTSTAQQYTSAVPASKVILGVPYYGRKACVGSPTPNQYPTSGVVADSYLDASGETSSNLVQPGSYAAHRDANDPAGQERWDTWVNTTLNCTRELYWDDTFSLGQKYDLVNRDNLRGVGIWNLNYGGGAPELWATLNTHFACEVSINVPASPATTEFSVGLSAGTCSVASYDIAQYDSTLSQGWFGLKSVAASANAGTAVVEGFPGHTYQFEARAHTASGQVGSWSLASTAVATTATFSHPFKGLYTLDAYGGVNGDSSPPLGTSAYWPGWKIARVAKALPGAMPQTGAVLDGWGGLHSYGAPIGITTSAYWPGWDIARDFAFLPDGSGGYVLDGYGGLHPFALSGKPMPPAVSTGAYWPGWDIARKVAIFSDGTGGYVLDGWGGLHAFGIGGPRPAAPVLSAYWVSWDIIHDFSLIPGTHSGYVMDGFGGIHPFTSTGQAMPPALNSGVFWSGWDIARSVWLLPGSTVVQPGGYVMDGYGGLHAFGNAPAPTQFPYWPYQDIARNITGY
jgi:spore germination protein YaaH